MAFKTLRAAISRSSTPSSSSSPSDNNTNNNNTPVSNTTTTTSSTASSSATDLSSTSPVLSPVTTVSTGLTLTTAPTATTTLSSSPPTTAPLQKTPSRLRQLLSRSKRSRGKTLDDEWHDYTGPRTRFRKTVDPLHRARLEAWEWDFGRRTSFGGRSYLEGASPFASPRCSVDVDADADADVEGSKLALKRVEANEIMAAGAEVTGAV